MSIKACLDPSQIIKKRILCSPDRSFFGKDFLTISLILLLASHSLFSLSTMISYDRDPQQTIPESSVKIIGLGGAGANMLDRATLDGMTGPEMVCINTDMRTLSSSVAGEKIQIGRNLTKGLGAGGDPDLGYTAAQEAEQEIRDTLRGRKLVIICVGLGGGTGSGAAPLITRIAREQDAFIVVFATMPFQFEGRRRREQAESALNELAALSNALVTFDNNRMGELVLAKQGIHQAFAAADRMVSEAIKAVTRLVTRPGMINIGLDELVTVLRTNRSRCLFGSGVAGGENRAQTAVENALNSPLLDKGVLLKGVKSLLVHLCAGETLTLYEVELLMQSLAKHVPQDVEIMFGVATDPAMGDDLSVTLISALPEEKIFIAEPALEAELSDDEPAGWEEDAGEDQPEAAASGQVAAIDSPEDEEIMEPSEGYTGDEDPDELHEADERGRAADADFDTVPDFSATEPSPEHEEDEEGDRRVAVEPPFAESEPYGDDVYSEQAQDHYGDDDGVEDPGELAQAQTTFFTNPFAKSRAAAQGELELDGGPKGKFEGESPNVLEGEDLDIPPFLRKKRG